ncbi:MAG: hypothetical protein Q7S88_01910 [Candidatus Daviesbacteria bacterium]|nr:hypothetical protein [Candidatus Daviesbacteria bacterium]
MSEKIRGALPRFQREDPVVRVDNVLRAKVEGKLPNLMDDVRRTYLASSQPEGSDITVYLKAVAIPYTGEHGTHFLVIPDRLNHQDMPGIADLSTQELQQTLQFAESIGKHTLDQSGIAEVDFGWHHAREGVKQPPKHIMASVPENLHIHVTGYSKEDMILVSTDEATESAYITGITDEAIYPLVQQLLFNEVLPAVRKQHPNFDELFQEVQDSRHKRRLKLTAGKEAFAKVELAEILKAMDLVGKAVYDEAAKCFFEHDPQTNQFIQKDDQYNRYQLLPRPERYRRVKDYIQKRPYLTSGVRVGLEWLAFMAKDEHQIIDREVGKAQSAKDLPLTPDEEKKAVEDAANRFWTYRNFVYAMVFSAQKTARTEPEWIFSFDPKIFTIGGITHSSANSNKLMFKDTNQAYSPEQLHAVQARERQVINEAILEHPEYKIGPGIDLNV